MLMKRFVLGLLSAGLCLNGLCSSPIPAPAPMKATHLPVKAAETEPTGKAPDERLAASVTSFSERMLKECTEESGNKNLILSPLSVIYALTLCSNGASGETLAEFEALNGIPTDEMNEYLWSYAARLAETENSTVRTANSLWGNKNFFTMSEDFRTVSEKYYNAESRSIDFADQSNVEVVNGWVSEKTDGLIPNAVEELNPATMLMLLNTVMFDGKWEKDYKEYQVSEGVFHGATVSHDNVEFMYSTENGYFEVDGGVGFSKMYKDGYAFTAVLPDGDLGEFIANADLGKIADAAMSGSGKVDAAIPKFEYETEMGLLDVLGDMGLKRAMSSQAELYGLSAEGLPLCIDQVLQKAKVITNEHGTKAAAMTQVSIRLTSARPVEKKIVHLDRPFFYMILDMETGIPLFTGAVYDLGE